MKKGIVLRSIDRYVIGLLAALLAASGLYLAGPWYLTEQTGGQSPIYAMFQSTVGTAIFGVIYIINGIALAWCVAQRGPVVKPFLACALFTGFLMRLYTLIGAILVLESWRPPNYLSALALVFAFGGYWVWVMGNEGTT